MGSASATKHQQTFGLTARRAAASSNGAAGLTLLVFGLVLVGLLMVYSASYAHGYEQMGDANFYLKRQLLAAAAGAVLFAICAALDHRRWMGLDAVLLGTSLVLTLATLLPGVATGDRWLRLGPFNLQPTELLKFSLIVYLAASLARRAARVGEFSQGVWPHLVVAGGAGLVSIAQPDFGMALMFLSVTYFCLFVAGVRLKHLLGTFLAALPPLAVLMIAAPYRRARLLSFLDPFADAQHGGYQIIQSLVSLGSGGLWGRGLGGGVEKLGYLPAAHTDFIFSVVGEELGVVGAGAMLVAFLALGWLGLRVARRAPDPFGRLLAAGIAFALSFQALMNLGVALGALPVTGLTLPFVSYGGSSLLVSMALAGMLVSVARAGGGHDQRAGLRGR